MADANRPGCTLLSWTLPGAIVLSTFLITQTLEKVKLSPAKSIEVKGFAERRIVSDFALWQGTFERRAPMLADAYEKMEKDLEIVLAYLQQAGLKKEEIGVGSIEISRIRKKNDKGESMNEIEAYDLEQAVKIHSPNVPLVSRISQESTTLIKSGIQFQSKKPEFLYTKLNDIKIVLLGEATRDAKARAEQLAVNSGGKVGSIRSARQGVFQITPVYSNEVSGSGENDTTEVEKSVKAVATVEFGLE